MNISLYLLLVFGVIAILIAIKKRSEDEPYFYLKVVGFYFLGLLSVKINSIVIPVGFLIFLLLAKRKITLNKSVKTIVTYIGFAVLITNSLIPYASNWLFERPTYVEMESTTLYEIDFVADWETISHYLELSPSAKVEQFTVEYEQTGKIKRLDYKIIDRNLDQFVLYRVNFHITKGKYSITAKKIDQWLQFDRLITGKNLFQFFETLQLNELLPKGNYKEYYLYTSGEYINYGEAGRDEKYLLDANGEATLLTNNRLPIQAYLLIICGRKGNQCITSHYLFGY